MAKAKREPRDESSVPATVRPAYEVVVGLTDAFCREHLNAEFEALCRILKDLLDVRSRGVKSFEFTLHKLARICLALSAGLLDAQGRDIVKVLSVAGKVTDLLDRAVGELADASKSRSAAPKDPKSKPRVSTGR